MLYCDSSMQRLFNSKVAVSTKNLASGSWAASILRKAFKLVNWSLGNSDYLVLDLSMLCRS